MSLRTKSGSPNVAARALMAGAIVAVMAGLFDFSLPANARNTGSGDSAAVAPLFASDSVMTVTIEAPLTTLMRDRPNEEYLDGKFSFAGDDGRKQTVDLRIRTRGEFRRKKKHCDFAPIRLNFRTEQLRDTVLAGQDKLKLVTHCRTKKKLQYEQLLLREFLAYRMLNVITEKSFRARLLRITYTDTEGGDPIRTFGFVIEDNDAVAARNGMVSIKTRKISGDDLDHTQQNLLHVFQYMIGNTEYSMFIAEPDDNCCHNIDLMSTEAGLPLTPVAYDFDFAGIVDAPYAAPHPRYGFKNVRRRLYKGRCKNNELLPDTIQRFIDGKDAIYSLIEKIEPLSTKSKRSVTRYLNGFYRHVSQAKSVNKRLVRRCKDSPRS